MKDQIYRLNQAEGIFYPAFDKYLCKDGQISIDQGKIVRLWDSVAFHGGSHYVVHWTGEVELGDYDHFLGFLSFPEEAALKVSGVVNGQHIVLIEQEQGDEDPVELKGKFNFAKEDNNRKLLTDLYLELNSRVEQNVIILSWLGLSRASRESETEKAVPVWKDSWDEEIVKEYPGKISDNMVLDEEEGEKLKSVVEKDAKLQEFYCANAEAAMKIDYKEIMREYAPQTPGMYRFVRVKDRGRAYLEGPILNLAIAGYLLGNAVYSVQAARLILALIAMKWYEGPVCEMEGSDFHHVCFTEEHMLTEVTLAMGFLGGVLKESARKRIADKVESAWRVITKKCMEPGYRNFMNQGIVGCRGALLGAVYLQQYRGGFEGAIHDCYKRHTGIVQGYLTEEGHCAEGGNYFEYSFSASILLWHVYAKYTGKTWAEVVPDEFCRAGRYQEALMSVNSRTGQRITVNCDAGKEVSTLPLVFMTLVCDFPEGNNYLIARFEGEKLEQDVKSFDMLFYQYYKGQIKLHPYYRKEKEEVSLPRSGLLTYRHGSTKLLVGVERNPYTGHFHEDRGQIVLQAAGETLLPDLGTVSYGNTKSLLMDKQAYHNIACPPDILMQVESEAGKKAAAAAGFPITETLTVKDMAVPEARVLSHEITADGYRFSVETGMLFGKGISGIRQGHLEKKSLRIIDCWHFKEPHPLMVTYLSYVPWKIRADGQSAVSGRMALVVESERTARFELEEGMVDCSGRKVYILRIMTEASDAQRVVSNITWKARELSVYSSGWQNRIALQERLDQGGTIRIEEPGTYEIEDTLYIKSHTHLILGKGVVMKRSASSIGSFFLVNRGAFNRTWDSDITIEGMHLITNGVEARHHAAVYGLTGEISLFYVKRLRVFDFICMDLPRLSFGLHICTFEDILLERLHVEGQKDAVHLGTGKQFVIRHGIFRTYDDPIALNAHDYAVANPQMGWIEDGLIEDCYDLPDRDTTGYFCRILAGSWMDWYQGMEIQNSDTVVSNGRVYRAFQKPDGTVYQSMTAPAHEEGMCTLDGINWVMVQEEIVYDCGCRNLHFRDIHLQKAREIALSVHFDHDEYSRSVYPGSRMPVQENIIFENMVIQNEVACMVRSITPIDTLKICNSVIGTPKAGNSSIRLETLPGQAEEYPETEILLQGNTCYGEVEKIVECEGERAYRVVENGNLIKRRC